MTSHEIDYTIYGDDLQAVEIELDPQETVVAEAGAMNWMESDIAFEARMGDGSAASSGILGGLMSMGKRMLTGESLFMTHFTNQGVAKRRVAFSSPYPGKIMPVDLSQRGGTLMCQKDAFLCAAKGTKVSIAFSKRLGAGFFGGEGFILQKLEGDGMAFLHAGGTVVEAMSFTASISGDRASLDEGAYITTLADVVGVPASSISVAYSRRQLLADAAAARHLQGSFCLTTTILPTRRGGAAATGSRGARAAEEPPLAPRCQGVRAGRRQPDDPGAVGGTASSEGPEEARELRG